MQNDDRVRILHMIDAAESVEQFIAERKRGDLDTDRMLLFAIVRAIEVIIHGYFDIDSDVVWKTVKEEIPGLLRSLKLLVEKG